MPVPARFVLATLSFLFPIPLAFASDLANLLPQGLQYPRLRSLQTPRQRRLRPCPTRSLWRFQLLGQPPERGVQPHPKNQEGDRGRFGREAERWALLSASSRGVFVYKGSGGTVLLYPRYNPHVLLRRLLRFRLQRHLLRRRRLVRRLPKGPVHPR